MVHKLFKYILEFIQVFQLNIHPSLLVTFQYVLYFNFSFYLILRLQK